MTMRLDSRQSRQRSVLDQLSNSTDLRLDVILNLINDELTMPLRMSADATPSLKLNIGAIEVQTIDGSNGTGRKRTIQPISNLLPSFTAGFMTFPASSGGTITASGFSLQSAYTLTVTSGNYIKVMIALNSLGQVVLSFGTEGASEAAATVPVALSGTLALGYVVLQNVGGVVQSVTDSNIRQFSGGGGGGGSGASAKQVTQNSHGFKVGNVVYLNGSTYALAKADTSPTAEAIGVISSVVTANIFEVTELGYLSGVDTTNTVEGGAALTAGTVYFLSASTAGKLTATEPSTIGYVSKPMLIADGASSGYALNYRGIVLGGVNARTQLPLLNNTANQTMFNAASYDAGELTGWVYISGTTSYRFQIKIQFAKNGAGSDYNVSYQSVGDTPPAGFAVGYTSPNITMSMPNVAGFASAIFNYALNAPAVGATFDLSIDASKISTGTVSAARLPNIDTSTLINSGITGLTGAAATTAVTAGSGKVGEKVTWTTSPSTQSLTVTETDWTNATFTLSAGVWVITALVQLGYTTGTTSGNGGAALCKLTDSSNTLIQTQYQQIGITTAANAAVQLTGIVAINCVETITSGTKTYKLRVLKADGIGVGSGTVYNQNTIYSTFFAIRIA